MAHEGEFEGLTARIIQHENDHLDGVLFFERMTPADRMGVRGELRAVGTAAAPIRFVGHDPGDGAGRQGHAWYRAGL